jgi:hypothetical protein
MITLKHEYQNRGSIEEAQAQLLLDCLVHVPDWKHAVPPQTRNFTRLAPLVNFLFILFYYFASPRERAASAISRQVKHVCQPASAKQPSRS